MIRKILDAITVKKIYMLMLVVFVASLIPILGLAMYGYPSADDFSASDSVRMAWLASGSILEVIKAAWQNTVFNYLEWSGVYASVFWTSLQPGIFGERWYGVTAWVTIILLTSSVFYLSHVIFHTYLKANRYVSACITLLYLFITIHCMPDGNEGIYWHAGVVNYTWAFAFLVFLIGLVLSLYKEKEQRKKIVKFVVAVFMALFVGGGNYITALQGSLLMLLFAICIVVIAKIYLNETAIVFLKKNVLVIIPLFVVIIAFAISVLAPGNQVRMNESQGMSAISAVLYSFGYAIKVPIQEWLKWPVVLPILLSIPLIIYVVKRVDYSFSCPFLVIIIGYCLFATTFTPTLYAQASFGEGRVENVSFFIWLLITYMILVYLSGWIVHKGECKVIASDELSQKMKFFVLIFGAFFVVLTIVCVRKDTTIFIGTDALYSLVTGEAKQYKIENEERLKILHDDNITEVVLPAFKATPSLLIFQDISSNPEEWLNTVVAEYYHKESVRRE